MFDVSYQKVVWEDGKVRIPPFMEGGGGGGGGGGGWVFKLFPKRERSYEFSHKNGGVGKIGYCSKKRGNTC